jgi:TonB family protein
LANTGLIKNGIKEGVWIGKYSDGNLFYTEEYEAGKCIKGTAYYGNEAVNYTNPFQNAEMIGGKKGYQTHLLTNLRYPIDAQRSRTTGKVHLAFEVCTDGSLCNYEILIKAAPTLDEEALRVIKPALFRGKPLKAKFNLPISFNLE